MAEIVDFKHDDVKFTRNLKDKSIGKFRTGVHTFIENFICDGRYRLTSHVSGDNIIAFYDGLSDGSPKLGGIGDWIRWSEIGQAQEGISINHKGECHAIVFKRDYFISCNKGLHPDSVDLVKKTASRMEKHLIRAQTKYGMKNGWRIPPKEMEGKFFTDEASLRKALVNHVLKGDAMDVLLYAAFMVELGYTTWERYCVNIGEGDVRERLSEHNMEDKPWNRYFVDDKEYKIDEVPKFGDILVQVPEDMIYSSFKQPSTNNELLKGMGAQYESDGVLVAVSKDKLDRLDAVFGAERVQSYLDTVVRCPVDAVLFAKDHVKMGNSSTVVSDTQYVLPNVKCAYLESKLYQGTYVIYREGKAIATDKVKTFVCFYEQEEDEDCLTYNIANKLICEGDAFGVVMENTELKAGDVLVKVTLEI